jgi:hypothetical protein
MRKDEDLYSEDDPYTEWVGGHFHRIFSKIEDTESFAGAVGDAQGSGSIEDRRLWFNPSRAQGYNGLSLSLILISVDRVSNSLL